MENRTSRFAAFKKSGIRTGASLLAVATILGVLVAGGGKWSQLRGDQDEKGLKGSWEIKINGTPWRILRTVGVDGVVDAYDFPPFGTIPFGTVPGVLVNSGGHGDWIKTGPNQYSATVEYFQINPSKGPFEQLDSVGKVRENIRVSKDGKSYVSVFETTIYRPDGSVLLTNPGGTTATRIVVEPLSATP